MYISDFKIFHNFFIYRPILLKNNRVLPLTNTKHSKFQYNWMFVSSVIVLTRNVTDRRTDRHFESCSEFDYKHNGTSDIYGFRKVPSECNMLFCISAKSKIMTKIT